MPAPLMNLLPDLPPEERADLRYRCGFGCVRCGVTIYQYLALPAMPESSRKESVPDVPTLLCPTCHALVEDGRLSPAQVHGFHASPLARQRHFARDRLPFSNDLPELALAGSRTIKDTPIPIAVEGEPLLLFAPPRQGVGATRISIRLGDAEGEPMPIIDGNEWMITDESWTFSHRGDRFVIAAAAGEGLTILRIASRTRIVIEHLRTVIRGRRIEATPDWLDVDGARLSGGVASGVLIGLDL